MGSRSFALLLVIASPAMTIGGAYAGADAALPPDNTGFGLTIPSRWIDSPELSMLAALGVDFAVMAGILLLNRSFNLIRGLRGAGWLFAALYMLMQGATGAAGQFTGGSLLVLVAIASFFLLYSVYQRPDMARRVLLVFVMLGAGSLIDYGFIPYLIVMAAGCVQMRVMGMRCIIAMLAGTLVPLWVLWAFGLIEPCSFSMPEVVSIFAPESHRPALRLVTATVVVMAAGIVTGLLDMLQVYARNARTRAFFGLFAVTGIMTMILSVIDFNHIYFYAPLLNVCTAFFMTLLYSFRQRGSLGAGTVAISLVTVAFAVLYIWKIINVLMS